MISLPVEEANRRFSIIAFDAVDIFEMDKENKVVIENLIKYFIGDPSCGYDLKKGICLRGNVGSGKTLIMKILRKCNFPENAFFMKDCREMSELFLNENYKGINPFGKGSVTVERVKHICFDDLGAENDINYYGNKVNVMLDIVTDRHKHFIAHSQKTHFTTNLSKTEMEKKYGLRFLSRMHEMANFVTLGGSKDSKDRRIKPKK